MTYLARPKIELPGQKTNAIGLTLRRRPNTKYQEPGRQVHIRREDRVRLVKMKSEGRLSR